MAESKMPKISSEPKKWHNSYKRKNHIQIYKAYMTKDRTTGLSLVLRITYMALQTASSKMLMFAFPSMLTPAILMHSKMHSYVL